MPITYDIKKDHWYQEGRQQGRRKGRQEGRQEGKQEKEKIVIIKMLKSGSFSDEQIADMVEVPVSYVQKLKTELQKK